MSGGRSKKSGGQYDDPQASDKKERPSLGTGTAERAATAIEKAKVEKEKRLKEIMEGK